MDWKIYVICTIYYPCFDWIFAIRKYFDETDDSISLFFDDGSLFVGVLNPLYELEMHKGTEIERTWNYLLSRNPGRIYYGHAKTAVLNENETPEGVSEEDKT